MHPESSCWDIVWQIPSNSSHNVRDPQVYPEQVWEIFIWAKCRDPIMLMVQHKELLPYAQSKGFWTIWLWMLQDNLRKRGSSQENGSTFHCFWGSWPVFRMLNLNAGEGVVLAVLVLLSAATYEPSSVHCTTDQVLVWIRELISIHGCILNNYFFFHSFTFHGSLHG
jgi:hypothetical protein